MQWQEYVAEVLVTEEALQSRIAELGAQISRDYQGQDLLLVCVLKGGVMFLTDLMRQISIPHAIDFMAVSSYGTGVRDFNCPQHRSAGVPRRSREDSAGM